MNLLGTIIKNAGLRKIAGGAALAYGGSKLSEEYNNFTGTRGGGLYTGLASVASTAIGYGFMAQGGINLYASAAKKVATMRAYSRLKSSSFLTRPKSMLSGGDYQFDPIAMKSTSVNRVNKAKALNKARHQLTRAKSSARSLINQNYKSMDSLVARGAWKSTKLAGTLAWGLAPSMAGFGAGASAGGLAGYAMSDATRTRSKSGAASPGYGIQLYDPSSGKGPREMMLDPFGNNTAGLVQALHKLS